MIPRHFGAVVFTITVLFSGTSRGSSRCDDLAAAAAQQASAARFAIRPVVMLHRSLAYANAVLEQCDGPAYKKAAVTAGDVGVSLFVCASPELLSARDAEGIGNYADALFFFQRAGRIAPENPDARSGYLRARTLLAIRGGRYADWQDAFDGPRTMTSPSAHWFQARFNPHEEVADGSLCGRPPTGYELDVLEGDFPFMNSAGQKKR